MDSSLGPLTEPTVLPNRGSLSDLRLRVVFSGYLWNKLSIFGLFSLSETGAAYSSRSLRLFMNAGNYISILKSVKEKYGIRSKAVIKQLVSAPLQHVSAVKAAL